ncbi:MAG: hypothetical protein COA79_02350 [Planctomycetota bacterium]|nr:MAG: hypothetical protein COA79_02350 [Planctomycetota bacterium]
MLEVKRTDEYCEIIMDNPLIKSYSNDLYFTVGENIDRGLKKFILNLNQVDKIDSAGLEVLLRIHEEVDGLGGKLVILQPQPLIEKILKLTKVQEKINIYMESEHVCSIMGRQS